jgi:hypothetical protein
MGVKNHGGTVTGILGGKIYEEHFNRRHHKARKNCIDP